MDCTQLGSSVHGILQVKTIGVACHFLLWDLPDPGIETASLKSTLAGGFFTTSTTWEAYHFSAAAAKSLQSCPTLCNPIESSPPGSSVPGILQARTLEWVAISFSNISLHDGICYSDSLGATRDLNVL